MASAFAQWPQALAATLEIAERCDVELELDRQLIPAYPVPEGETDRRYLRALVERGLRERYGDPPPAATLERMETELEVIDRMGFNSYFLIVWDFVDFAKRNGIAVGPGRGSAAGSIVAYSLRITDVDPLAYDLLFERFLNPERVSMPDIDIDFSVRGRERVLRYVIEKYGRESVAQIVTFGRMAPRQATRDAARVLGHDYGVGDRLAKLIPDPQQGRPPSFEDCLAEGEPLRAACDEDPTARQIIDVARGLEGVVRNSSIHAAAVVIADRPLTDIVPLQLAERRARGGRRAAVPHRHAVLDEADREDRPAQDGLPRAAQPRRDRGRARHHRALDRRAAGHGDAAARRSRDLRDARRAATRSASSSSSPRACARRSRRCARTASTTSSRSTRSTAPARWTRSRPTRAASATPRAISYPDERLRPILGSSMGVILYQEQAMRIAKEIAGFSGAKADDLRKAIGKKDREAMAQAQARVRRGRARERHLGAGDRLPLVDQREVRRLLVQPQPRRVLRADRLPHRVAEGQLPRRVHGGADLLGDVDQGPRPVLRRALRGDGDRDPAAGRQPLRPRVHGRRAQHPLRPRRRQGRRASRPSRRSSARARRAGRSPRCGTSASASTPARSTRRRSRR